MLILGIAGGSGSGKTTFVEKVRKCAKSSVSILNLDSYYLNTLPEAICGKNGPKFDHPDAFDWALIDEHIKSIIAGFSVEMPIYDFKNNKRSALFTTVKPNKVLLLEGIYALHLKSIRKYMDIKCFLNVEADIRFCRRLGRDIKERGRDVEGIIDQYYTAVRPMYEQFGKPQVQHADIIVGEETSIAADVLAAKIYSYLQNKKQPNQGEEFFEKQN